LTFHWLMESIQIFLKLDSLFKAKLNVRAKTIQLINRSVGNIGFRWSYIISVLILQRHAYLWSTLLGQERDINPAICGQSCFLIMPKPAKRAARWVVPYLYSALLLVSLSLCRPFHKYPHIFGGLWEVSEILIQKILI